MSALHDPLDVQITLIKQTKSTNYNKKNEYKLQYSSL